MDTVRTFCHKGCHLLIRCLCVIRKRRLFLETLCFYSSEKGCNKWTNLYSKACPLNCDVLCSAQPGRSNGAALFFKDSLNETFISPKPFPYLLDQGLAHQNFWGLFWVGDGFKCHRPQVCIALPSLSVFRPSPQTNTLSYYTRKTAFLSCFGHKNGWEAPLWTLGHEIHSVLRGH